MVIMHWHRLLGLIAAADKGQGHDYGINPATDRNNNFTCLDYC